MTRPPLFERLRYAFDNTLTGGPLGLVTWLASFTAILILSLAFMVMLIGGAPSGTGFNDLLWMGFNQTLDPTSLDNTLPSAILFAMVFAAVGGLFITSTLVGIVTTEMQGRIEGLREGRSRVIERDHIVVLGWTPNVFTILAELVEANSNQARCCIVVLGEEDRTTMEHRVAERLGDTGSTRIVCRSGSAVDIDDLYIANIHAARSIIILTPTGEGSDVAVIKTLLAILNSKQRRPEPYHIVAALSDPSNAEVARLVAGDEAVIILSEDVIARIIAQTAGQPGLSLVYQDLLDFAEDDDTTHLRKGGAADIDTDAFRATNAVADPRWRVLMLG